MQKRHRSLELIVSELLVGELPSFFRRRVDIELFKSALDAAAAFALRQLGAHEGFGIALVVDDVCVGCAPKGVRDSLLAKAVLDEPLIGYFLLACSRMLASFRIFLKAFDSSSAKLVSS